MMQGITKDNAFGVGRLASTGTARVCDVSDIVDDGACRRGRRSCRWCCQCSCCRLDSSGSSRCSRSSRGCRQRRQLFIDTRDVLASAQAVAARLFAIAADLAPAAQRAGAVAVSTVRQDMCGQPREPPLHLLSQTYTAGLLRRRTSGSGMVFWVPMGRAVGLVEWCFGVGLLFYGGAATLKYRRVSTL